MGRPDVRQAQVRLRGAVPPCATEFSRVSAANLRLAQRSVPPIAAGRQRLVGMKRYRAFVHLMPCVHEVEMDDQLR